MIKMSKIASLLLYLVAVGWAAEHSVGLRADMVGQGFAYRFLTNSGWGAEIVALGRYDLSDSVYNFGTELRILKRFDTSPRLKIYLGAAGGFWQFQDYYWFSWVDDTGYYHDEQVLYIQNGISGAALVGVDIKLFEFGSSGLCVAPEFQFGYYSTPNRHSYYYDPLQEGEEPELPKPDRFIMPGAGIGLYYYF